MNRWRTSQPRSSGRRAAAMSLPIPSVRPDGACGQCDGRGRHRATRPTRPDPADPRVPMGARYALSSSRSPEVLTVSRFTWVADSARLLRQTGDEFERTQPFAGLRIGTGIHLEPKTAALLLTLRRGGAEVVSTGNLNSTQQETVDYLRANEITVIGGPTADPAEHDRFLREVLATQPDLMLDNGGDLFSRYLEAPWDGLRGGTEETTSGRDRLLPLRDQLRLPILVINDSPIKQFGENTHAVGAGTVESFIRITNRITNGRRVVVFGYGSVGRGVAAYFRSFNSIVSVVEPQPVLRMRALLDGFEVPDRDDALATADVVVTVTGAPHVIEPTDLGRVRDGVVLVSAGHLPWELDVPALIAD